ncbi:hypothetical protein LEP1GSC005_4196 [Leptospira santarosai str. ST188]|nr:hypothetical protein LEP1GSC068_0535 [Leptospira sp. Fiocruz LV3954]EMF90517.1 hypothetical protein LEP1GSC005_4196 [Leptospira santarosai str. ST188]EMI63631.1 hypothetical protein LEP1GSC076_4098 [Leptospira sp. Fiocruz LV4135]
MEVIILILFVLYLSLSKIKQIEIQTNITDEQAKTNDFKNK